ncbi:NAD(P)-binding protein [Rubinisphaera italica]|uniref:NAD(P)-binding protein n=1 Tax=Rubinisphaera italica TaxID=2527969 RepID=UPI0013EEF7D6|nr:NAD(P)-binding protein [Rubinisphaera italica]
MEFLALVILRVILIPLVVFLLLQASAPHWITKWGRFFWLGKTFTWSRRVQDLVTSGSLLSIGVLGLVLGFVGTLYPVSEEENSLQATPLENPVDEPLKSSAIENALYETIQILTFDGSIDVKNIYQILAADCAVALAFIIALELIRKLFRDTFLSAMFFIPKYRRTIICGLGRIGRQVMEDLGGNCWLIIVEPDPDNPSLERARELGATIITGDARSEKLLRWIGAHHADQIYFVTGNDEANAETILDVANLVLQKKSGKKRSAPKCFLQMGTSSLIQMIRDSPAIKDSGIRSELVVFDALDNAAKQLVLEMLPDYRPAPDQVAHFVIWGFGPMGQKLALSLAEFAHFDNLKRSRMTILYQPDEQSFVDTFREEYPNFAPDPVQLKDHELDGWNWPVEADEWGSQHLRPSRKFTEGSVVEYCVNAAFIEQPDSLSNQSLQDHLNTLSDDSATFPILMICSEDDRENAMMAERIHQLFKQNQTQMPVFVWIPVQPKLAEMIASLTANEPYNHRLIPFGQSHECCSLKRIDQRLREDLAKVISAAYDIKNANSSDNVARLNDKDNYQFYWSNISAACHAPFKLATVGLEVMPSSTAKNTNRLQLSKNETAELQIDQNMESTIAAMEHHRWMAERLLSNWQFEAVPDGVDPYPDEENEIAKDRWDNYKSEMTRRRRRHQFLPFDQLHPKDEAKDKDQISTIIRLCSGHYEDKFTSEPICLVRKESLNA